MTWKKGDPLPDNERWTWEMVEQYSKRSRRTLQRRGLPNDGEPGRFDPATVRRFFSRDFNNVGLRRAS